MTLFDFLFNLYQKKYLVLFLMHVEKTVGIQLLTLSTSRHQGEIIALLLVLGGCHV